MANKKPEEVQRVILRRNRNGELEEPPGTRLIVITGEVPDPEDLRNQDIHKSDVFMTMPRHNMD